MRNIAVIYSLSALVLSALACNAVSFGDFKSVRGSGVAASQQRTVAEFNAIELIGSADVIVTVGGTQSVLVEADDNILPLIETKVNGSKLIIGTKPGTSITPKLPVRVTVSVKSIQAASITGSGSIDIKNLAEADINFGLSGSGTITAAGTASRLSVSLSGSGNVNCDSLKAKSVTVQLGGSGNVNVQASESLDASITGSGNVRYRGNPAKVNSSVTGSGNINPIP